MWLEDDPVLIHVTLIRVTLIRVLSLQEAAEKRIRDMLELQRMEKEQLNFKKMREDAERAEEDEFKRQVSAGLTGLLDSPLFTALL